MEALYYNANKALLRAITVLWSKILTKWEYYSKKGKKRHPMDMMKWTYHDKHLNLLTKAPSAQNSLSTLHNFFLHVSYSFLRLLS